MKAQRWGRIIFISSIAAYGGGINVRGGIAILGYMQLTVWQGCHYAASKGGIMGMMKNLATTLAPFNISVNDVAPALIGNTGLIPNGDNFPGLVDSIPLHRLGEPDEVANAVIMYATTGFATGQSIVIAGGLK